jgi:hypothetical protein
MPRVKSETKLDLKELRAFAKKLKTLDSYEVEFGYYDSDLHPDYDMGMATLAAIHEFGGYTSTGARIPARDFMHQTIVSYSGVQGMNALENVVEGYLFQGKNIRTLLAGIGKQLTDKVVWTIEQGGDFTPNSQMTITYKGSDVPLVHSGYMRDHAKYKVKKVKD